MSRPFRPLDQLPRRAERAAQITTISEREAAEVFGYFDRGCANPVRAFQQCARRLGIPVQYAGRFRRYNPRVLTAFLERETWTRKHRLTRAS